MICKCCGKEARWCGEGENACGTEGCDHIQCDHCGMHYSLESEAAKNAETFEEMRSLMLEVYTGDILEGPEALKRQLEQANLNVRWMIGMVDQIHAILCPDHVGTWQQRAEQVLRVGRRKGSGDVEKLEGPIERRMSGEICVEGVRTEHYLRDRMGRDCVITVGRPSGENK